MSNIRPLLLLIYSHKTLWASYQIRKIAGCACAGNAGNVSPRRRFQRKSPVSDPGMHHGTCVTHVPWCMSGSFTCGEGKRSRHSRRMRIRNFVYLARGPSSHTLGFANEVRNFNRHYSPSVVLQMAARAVVQSTSYHPPLGPLPMATHPICNLSSPAVDPQYGQLVYVGYQPLDHSNVLCWNNYYSYTDCDDNILPSLRKSLLFRTFCWTRKFHLLQTI